MRAVRKLREEWHDLTPEGVKWWAEQAYGGTRAAAMILAKVRQVQHQKAATED